MSPKKEIISRSMIVVSGNMPRHKIVRKVIIKIIQTEYRLKGRGVVFKYPVENMPNGKLYISRPGHKKNFDFRVEIREEYGIGDGTHIKIADDLRSKRFENEKKFKNFQKALADLYHCRENDVDKLLKKYHLVRGFKTGAKVEIILKVLKWLFIMEDIIYWDVEGRAYLFNFLQYLSMETDEERRKKAVKLKKPEQLKSYMEKAGLKWIPYEE